MKVPEFMLIAAVAIIITLFAAGCASTGVVEPAVPPIDSTDTPASAPSPIPMTESGTTGSTAEETTDMHNEDDPLQDEDGSPGLEEAGGDESVRHEAVSPVVVDLGDLTAQPAEDASTPRAIHAPGLPNPAAIAANRAAATLAGELALDVEDVTILRTESVEWPDSSLGCPKSGQNYLMVITPGFRVSLKADGQTYEYHTNRDGTVVVRCEGGVRKMNRSVDR